MSHFQHFKTAKFGFQIKIYLPTGQEEKDWMLVALKGIFYTFLQIFFHYKIPYRAKDVHIFLF